MRILDAGNITRTITRCRAVDVGGIVRSIRRIRVLDTDGTTWRTAAYFADPLTASAFPVGADGLGDGTITTNSVTVIPTGGVGPYTYSWAMLSYSAATPPTIASAGLATTFFTQTGVGAGDAETATFRCTVTDSGGESATVVVAAIFRSSDFS